MMRRRTRGSDVMKTGIVAGTFLVAALAASGGAWLGLHRANMRLRQQLAEMQAHAAATLRIEEQNRRLEAVVRQAQVDEPAARLALDAEVDRARSEVAELERIADKVHAEKIARDAAAAEALTANRDLTKGPVLVQNCANAGRATPVAAFETLVWASMQGDDELVASMIALDGASRALVEAFLARLPESTRRQYPTAGRLAALVFAEALTNLPAVEIVAEKPLERGRTMLTISRLSGKTTDLVMELGPSGWQVAAADRRIFEQFVARIAGGVGAGKSAAP
jgi:hypothetical protein